MLNLSKQDICQIFKKKNLKWSRKWTNLQKWKKSINKEKKKLKQKNKRMNQIRKI